LELFVYIIVFFVSRVLFILQLLMVARAIISWLPFDDDSAISRFLIMTTEPIIFPIRKILERSSFFASLPIDVSFLFAYLLLSFLTFLLPSVRF